MDKILSIIIPTYNMEKYLRKCLDSLIVSDENMQRLEVLVINDGSKDSSSQIAHECEAKYPQTFRVIDKENGNYGSCINRGLKEANGKYIKILDADDSFNSYSLCSFLEILHKVDADLFLTDFHCVDNSDREISISRCVIPTNEILNMIDFTTNHSLLWLQMHSITYRRRMLIDMAYHQTEGVSYTDKEWAYLPLCKVKTFFYLPVVLYNYLIGRDGQTMDKRIYRKSLDQLMKVCIDMISMYHDYRIEDCPIANILYFKLSQSLKYLYRTILILDENMLEDLAAFDSKLQLTDSQLFQRTYDLRVFDRVPFTLIRYWRNRDKQPLPFVVKCSLYILIVLTGNKKA